MIVIVGLIFLGLWAAGEARQKGRNQYLWSLVPIGLYLVIFLVTTIMFDWGWGTTLMQVGGLSLSIAAIVKVGLIPVSFILSKFLLDALFKRMTNRDKEKEKN